MTTSPSPVPFGTTTAIVVTATEIDPTQPTMWSLDAVDTAGSTKHWA